MIGGTELAIIGAIVFFFFGATKLPEFARSFGKAKAEFAKASRGEPTPSPADAKQE